MEKKSRKRTRKGPKEEYSLVEHLSSGKSIGGFFKQKNLKSIAKTGKGSFVRDVAGMLFERNAAKVLGDIFDKRYGEGKQKAAQRMLGEKAEKKPTKSKEKEPSAPKEIVKNLIGLINVVKSISQDTTSIKQISSEIMGSVTELKSQPQFTQENIKPQTISHEDKEYLHYPQAPEGRQYYEKSKKGTAGKIASKNIQKQLKKKIATSAVKKERNAFIDLFDETLAPTKTPRKSKERKGAESYWKEMVGETLAEKKPEELKKEKELSEKLSGEETAVKKLQPESSKMSDREKQLDAILKRLEQKDGDKESKEQLVSEQSDTEILKDAIKKAIEELKKEDPDLFGGGGGITDTIENIAGMFLSRKAAGAVGKLGSFFKGRGASGAVKAAEGAGLKAAEGAGLEAVEGAGLKAAEGAGGKAVAKTAEKAVAEKVAEKGGAKLLAKTAGKTVLKSVVKKIPLIGAIAGLGFAAMRAAKGDWAGAALEAASGVASTLPGLGTAASIGIDASLAARDAGAIPGMGPPQEEGQASEALGGPTEGQGESPSTVPAPLASNEAGKKIIEMNREIKKAADERMMPTAAAPAAPVVQNINQTTMIPLQTDKKMTVSNAENTFNRLLMQDMDHPSTYSNFNMG